MGRRSTFEEFTLPGSEANMACLTFASGGLFLASLVVFFLPWWTLALAGAAALAAVVCMRDR